MAEIKNIHDHFFKRFFSDVANVRELLNLVLPTEVREQLDLSVISLEPTSYVSEEYRASLSDLVIKTRTKRKRISVDIYFLFEHKSYPDKRAPVQLLRYMYLEWRQDQEEKRPLRVIIPVVFYHGRRPWNIPTDFMDQFSVPEELKPFMLNFRYILFDTNQWDWKKASSAVVKENVFALTAVLLMMAASRRDLEIVRRVLQLWQEMGIIKEKELFTFIMIYIVETQDVSLSKIEKILEETHIKGEDIMPTLAQRLREEGYKAGIEQG
ncbi:MAG: Rpn family recombination-promoting nuclease/putative transposase, partial [Calditrichaeota bacterium]